MKIAVCSDEPYAVNDYVVEYLQKHGHSFLPFGSVQTKKTEEWGAVTANAAQAVAQQTCDEGIFFCWTGTGASIVANKVAGIRAALCTDAETAKGARIWNDANVLVLSNRLTSVDLAREILDAWFANSYAGKAKEALKTIEDLESDAS